MPSVSSQIVEAIAEVLDDGVAKGGDVLGEHFVTDMGHAVGHDNVLHGFVLWAVVTAESTFRCRRKY